MDMKRLLGGLDEINGTELVGDERSDYRKISSGVQRYLQEQDEFTDDEVYKKHLINGIAFSLYCKTGFPRAQVSAWTDCRHRKVSGSGSFSRKKLCRIRKVVFSTFEGK